MEKCKLTGCRKEVKKLIIGRKIRLNEIKRILHLWELGRKNMRSGQTKMKIKIFKRQDRKG